MSSLYIIGNGFDLSHGLKTSYENFHQYLIENYPDAYFDSSITPESTLSQDGDDVYDENEVVGFIMHIISEAEPRGEKWSDLENSLGYLDFDEFLDDWTSDDDEDEDNEWDEVYRNQDIGSNLVGAVLRITGYFEEWINTIDINKINPKPDFKKLIDVENDKFLTFNYTKTMEELYKVKNVCHIHGEQGGELLFGHGNDNDYYDDNMSSHIGSEDSLQEIQDGLMKNTKKAVNNNKTFFERLSPSVDKIYSYGFSFSKVDEIYIREICENLSTTNVTWYFNDFDCAKQRDEYRKIIESCGFMGDFSTYHIS